MDDYNKSFSMTVNGLLATWSNRYGAKCWFNLIGGNWSHKERLLTFGEVHVSGHHIILSEGILFEDWLTPELRENYRQRELKRMQDFCK